MSQGLGQDVHLEDFQGIALLVPRRQHCARILDDFMTEVREQDF